MNDQYLLGVDIGTSSIKVALLSLSGNLVNIESMEHSILSPEEGWAELSIAALWNNFIICLNKLVDKNRENAKNIKAIGISCLCPGLIPFDKNGNALLNPIIYMDRRTIREVELIKEKISEEDLSQISSNKLMPGACSLTSMLWIKRNREEIYKHTLYFGHINTYFVHKLTGKFGIDYTNASYTGLFETSGGLKWSVDIADLVGIDIEKMPPLIRSDERAGDLISEEVINIGLEVGIPVAMGGADTACSALAVGVVDHNDVFESVGTTNVISICSAKPVFDIRFMNRCHVVRDRWIYHGAMSSTGASLKWFRDEFCKDFLEEEAESGINAYRNMDNLAECSPPGANGIVFLPYMAGERSPVWDPYAKGVFFGLSLRTKREDILRSILEGCGFGMKQLFEIAERIVGGKIEKFISIGGGAKSSTWSQIKADITGKDIEVLNINNAAVIGAALLGGTAAGIFENSVEASKKISKNTHMIFHPNAANVEVYQKGFQVYNSLYPSLRNIFNS